MTFGLGALQASRDAVEANGSVGDDISRCKEEKVQTTSKKGGKNSLHPMNATEFSEKAKWAKFADCVNFSDYSAD
jgi:hypothetical protein